MSKILIADIEVGASRLRRILSGGHKLEFAENIADVLALAEKQTFDLVVVGVHFDNSSMFDLISAAKKTTLAQTPFVGFAENHTELSISARESLEGIMHVLGGADYIDTQGMSDAEILERIETSLKEAKGIGARSKASDTPRSKRMAQSSQRWTKVLNESSPQSPHQILLVSTETELAKKIESIVKNFSGVYIKVATMPALSDGLVSISADKHSVLVCDLENLQTSDSRNAISIFAEQIPVVALTNSAHEADMLRAGLDASISFVPKNNLDINLALAILSAIAHVEHHDQTPEGKFSKFLLTQLRTGLQAVDTGEPLKDVLHNFCANMEAFARRENSDELFITILLRDENGKTLRSGAGPSIPEEYSRAIDGVPIGPQSGSCGTAAFLSRPVYVTDINSDPKWVAFLPHTKPHGLKACWSVPIIDDQQNVLATFAIYYTAPREPKDSELRLVGAAAETLKTILIYARTKKYSLAVD